MLKTNFILITTILVVGLNTPARAYDMKAVDEALNEAAEETDVVLVDCQYDYWSGVLEVLEGLVATFGH